MNDLPSGIVTFLFTDIEGSTRRWEEHPEEMPGALARHDAHLTTAVEVHGGAIFKHTGDGMCAVFEAPGKAVAAAATVQRLLARDHWAAVGGPLKVRSSVHSGEAETRDGDYFGASLSRAARIMDAAHGGQVLVSAVTVGLVGREPGAGLSLVDLGEHRFKDLGERTRVFQLSGEGLEAEFPPIRSLESVPNNLPSQLTSFVGRERELAEVVELISDNRLLTLTGVGGVGKTRLAVQAAAESSERFGDGAFLVELAAIEDPALVDRTVAEALGIVEQPTRPLLETMLDHVAGKELLIVLDNCEHVISSAAKLSELILRAAPAVHILATSREGLAIGGERLWQVPSMPVATDQPGAVDLFIERARLVRPGFVADEENREAIAKICTRLDGIPLAIELATARLKVFSPAQIAERLDDRFRLLTGGSRTALERHRTLQATMDWSYDLLTGEEQALLRRLAVFLGGFTFDAAEQVCSGELLPEYTILDLLAHLVDHSLVIADEAGEIRYRVLETVRQYGLNKLVEAGESDDARLHHARFFAAMADGVDEALLGESYTRAVRQINTEHDNFRAALTWTLEHGHGDLTLRIAAGLGRFWFFQSHYREGREWLERAVAIQPDDVSPAMAEALGWIGGLSIHMGAWERSREAATASVEMYERLGDESAAMKERNALANTHLASGRVEEARVIYDAVIAHFAPLGDNYVHVPMVNRSMVAVWQGDEPAAETLIEELYAFAERLDNPEIGAWTACCQGTLGAMRDDADLMEDAFGRALDHALAASQRLLEGWAHAGLADAARIRGEHARAHEHIETATRVGTESGAASVEWFNLMTRIDLAADEDDGAALEAALLNLLERASAWRDLRTLAMSALGYGIHIRHDDPPAAAQLLACHEAEFESQRLVRRRRHEVLFQTAKAELHAALGDAGFAAAWAAGSAVSPLDVRILMPDLAAG